MNREAATSPPPTGTTAAISTDDVAAWLSANPVRPANVPTDTASTTTSATCHGPRPMPRMSSSPTSTPMATPATSSISVRSRREAPLAISVMTAAIGAKNACS